MSLQRIGGDAEEYFKPSFDIIAVPAIGGDPVKTWMYPNHQGLEPENLWTELHEARVYLYFFHRRQDSKHEGITTYAEDLLQAIRSEVIDLGRRPLHFAAFSTGGLVVKRALLLALGGFDKGRYLSITRSCFSLAFFGTPHYGSNFLSLPVFKEGVKELFGLTYPYSSRLRTDIKHIKNLDNMQQFDELFIPYTVTLAKIWSFVETKETELRVKIGDDGKQGEAFVRVPLVDRHSSTLSKDDVTIGCEVIFKVTTDHINLSRFDNDETCSAFTQYIQGLKFAVDSALAVKVQDIYGLEQRIKAEVHLFYDCVENGEAYVKLWSVDPSLKTLFAFGPARCLDQRKTYAKETLAAPATMPSRSHRRAQTLESGSKSESPQSERTPTNSGESGDAESETSSTVTYQLPDVYLPKFRWIHVPANNMYWFEKIITAVEIECERNRLNAAEQGIDKLLEMAPDPPTPTEYAEPTRDLIEDPTLATLDPLASTYQKAIEVVKAKDEQSPVENVIEAVKNTKKAAQLIKMTLAAKNERTTFDMPETALLAEEFGERARILEAAKPEQEGQPFAHPNDVREAVKQERQRDKLGATLLNKRVWNSKQIEQRHDHPHGRYMEPHCEIFFPKKAGIQPRGLTCQLTSPRNFPQMCLYFPYLHWDTYGSVRARNDLVQARMNVKDSAPIFDIPESVVQQISLEHMMIWQYITHNANLPLHIRRTLDQFGYSTLEDTAARDADQVIFKCTRARRQKSAQRQAGEQKTQQKPLLWSRNRREKSKHQDSGGSDDDEVKLLMVDELWCWIVDPFTVITFFPAKEEPLSSSELRVIKKDIEKQKALLGKPDFARTSPTDSSGKPSIAAKTGDSSAVFEDKFPENECHDAPAKRIFSQADLRNVLHAAVNGDLQFATPCKDCFDFAALSVWHAVAVFLLKDKVIDHNLHVFSIFEEVIADKIEHHTKSFQRFKSNQNSVSLVSEHDQGSTTLREVTDQSLQETANTLDNGEDLSALWELLDVKDELKMLTRLFDTQKQVIDKMLAEYKSLDEYLASEPTASNKTHDTAIGWLEDAREMVDKYLATIDSLNRDRKWAQDALEKLLDMKQKQASVVEAYSARRANQVANRQNRAIMIFTVFTIIFLPLSFFTSLFGMNVRDWTNEKSNEQLRTVLIIMICISVALILITMLFALTRYPVMAWLYSCRALERHFHPRRLLVRRRNISTVHEMNIDNDEEQQTTERDSASFVGSQMLDHGGRRVSQVRQNAEDEIDVNR